MDNRICVKIGSNVLTGENGLPNEKLIKSITRQIGELIKAGKKIILVSSGAVAAGRGIFTSNKKLDTVAERQLLSSLGQIRLINLYSNLFGELGMLCSQVLVTRQDFKDRHHYLNMQNCLNALLDNNIIPIVNENDVISITELMFTDNDELAGLISAMLNVDTLYILTNVAGIYDANPDEKDAKLIAEVDSTMRPPALSGNSASGFGRGGIITKFHTAQKVARMGIPVVIADGKEENIIVRLNEGEKIGTFFKPEKKSPSNRKKWIATSQSHAKGYVVINEGAKRKLLSKNAASLLPVGVLGVKGEFKRGDIIRILDEHHKELGLGQCRYGSEKARAVIGMKNQKPVIHYDHLYLH